MSTPEIEEIERLYNQLSNGPLRRSEEGTLQTRLQLVIAKELVAIREMLTQDQLPPCFQNVNAYGENFAVAIQEGLVRGQRGISQYS